MLLFHVAHALGKSVEEVMQFGVWELRGWSEYLAWRAKKGVDQPRPF